jgi:hypothetical protein
MVDKSGIDDVLK